MTMKTYKKIVMIVSIIVGIIATAFLYSTSPVAKTKTITAEEYQSLKDYALDIANGSGVELPEEITVTKKFNEDAVIISLNTSLYGIEANFPISQSNGKFENGNIMQYGTIDYENVTYSEHPKVQPSWFYIIWSIISVFGFSTVTYNLFYVLPEMELFARQVEQIPQLQRKY